VGYELNLANLLLLFKIAGNKKIRWKKIPTDLYFYSKGL